MKISDEELDHFMRIYRREFGKRLTRGEALAAAENVLRLYTLLSRRLPDGRASAKPGPETGPPMHRDQA